MRQLHWTESVLIGFDTETTGINPKTARILEAAIITQDPEGILKEDDRIIYIDPEIKIPSEASAVHGITAEKLKKLNAYRSNDGVRYISNFLQCRSFNRNYPLVIYNVTYDWPLLIEECKRANHTPCFQPLFLDPLVIDRALDKYRKGSRKLEDTAKIYGVQINGAHGAQADAAAALGVMRALIKKFPELKKYTIEEMQKLQTSWYRTWRDGINDFWGKSGKQERILGEWPYGER